MSRIVKAGLIQAGVGKDAPTDPAAIKSMMIE